HRSEHRGGDAQPPDTAARSGADAPLGWPIVDRRHHAQDPPSGVERRGRGARSRGVEPIAPLAPFRIAAFVLGVVRAFGDDGPTDWRLVAGAAAVGTYALIT